MRPTVYRNTTPPKPKPEPKAKAKAKAAGKPTSKEK